MSSKNRLILIKFVHTAVWLLMATAALYILYAGINKILGTWLWVSIGLLSLESLILAMNKWTCPLTPIAMRYTSDRDDSFDIYLPRCVAKYNKIIFGTIFAVGLLLVFINLVSV